MRSKMDFPLSLAIVGAFQLSKEVNP